MNKIVQRSGNFSLEQDPNYQDWKRRYETSIEVTAENRCGHCLCYHTPKCDFSKFADVMKRSDLACAAFYPLAERLEVEKRRMRSSREYQRVRRELEQYE